MFPFFFFNDTATTEIYTLSLHDALPISDLEEIWILIAADSMENATRFVIELEAKIGTLEQMPNRCPDRKSTRLNSSHSQISYAVFCLKKKNKAPIHTSSPNLITPCTLRN